MQRHFDLRGSTCFKCCLSSTATCTSSRPNCHYMLGQVILESSLCSPRLFDLIISAFGFSVHPSRVWPQTNSWELLQYIRRSVHDSGFLYTRLFRSGGDIFCFAYVQTIVSKPVSVSTRGHFFILHNPSFIWNIEDFQDQTQHVKLLDKINNYLLVNWVGGLYGKVFKNMFTHCD